MDKESILNLMVDKFVEGNRYLGASSGMTPEEIELKLSEGMMAINYLLSEVYDELLAKDLLK
ncbi:MAG: hypothetical protein RLZZ195_1021 [Pseudomonadota bacterium]|jgi:hypothetical protein